MILMKFSDENCEKLFGVFLARCNKKVSISLILSFCFLVDGSISELLTFAFHGS